MRYRCRDCSYEGPRGAGDGRCPACGSMDISGMAPVSEEVDPAASRRRMILIGILLLALAWLLVDKL